MLFIERGRKMGLVLHVSAREFVAARLQVTPEEVDYLEQIAVIFGLDAADWDRIRAGNIGTGGAGGADPFHILGVTRDADDAAIKAAHRKLVLENHPDKLVAEGLPEEFVDLATEKLATINAAYDQIRKQRGI